MRRIVWAGAVLLLVSGCTSAENPTTTTAGTLAPTTTAGTLAPTTTAGTLAPTTTTAAVTELPLAEDEGLPAGAYDPADNPLAAGTYTTNVIEVPITFTVADGWVTINEAEVGPAWIPEEPIELSFIAVTKFYGEVFDDPCAAEPPAEIETSALALIEWLDGNPYLESSGIEEVTVGGQPGYEIEVTSTVPPECTEPPRLFLLSLPIVGDYHLDDGMTAHIMTVDAGGITLFISVESTTTDWAKMKAVGDPFIEMLVIG